MEKQDKNEGLQSRREFFKKAAKSALPMIAAVALASTPAVINAATTATGCSADGCSYTCQTTCHKGCYDGCQGSCKTTCTGGCRGGYTNLK